MTQVSILDNVRWLPFQYHSKILQNKNMNVNTKCKQCHKHKLVSRSKSFKSVPETYCLFGGAVGVIGEGGRPPSCLLPLHMRASVEFFPQLTPKLYNRIHFDPHNILFSHDLACSYRKAHTLEETRGHYAWR